MHFQSFLALTLLAAAFVQIISADITAETLANEHRNKCFMDGLTMLVQCNVNKVDSFANEDKYTAEECCLYKLYSDCVKAKVNESPCLETLKEVYNDQLDTILATKCPNVNCSTLA